MKLVHMCGIARVPDDCDISEFLGTAFISWSNDPHSFIMHVDHTKEVSSYSEATTQEA